MLSIYGIEAEWLRLLDMMEVDEETGEMDQAWEALADELLGKGVDKIDRAASVVKMLLARASTAKDEAKRMRERATMWEGQAARLKGRIGDLLDTVGERKVVGDRYTVSRTKARKRLEILSAEAIPTVYHVPQPPKIDKTAIKKAIEAGAEVDGAEIVLGDPGLMIR